jgi:arylsulfatase A-like enzyme
MRQIRKRVQLAIVIAALLLCGASTACRRAPAEVPVPAERPPVSVDLVCRMASNGDAGSIDPSAAAIVARNAGCGDERRCYYVGHDDRMRSLVIAGGDTLSASIDPMEGTAALRFSLMSLNDVEPPPMVTVTVERGGSSSDPIVQHELEAAAPESWSDHSIEIDGGLGEGLTIAFSSSEAAGLVAVGAPRVVVTGDEDRTEGATMRPNVLVYLIDTLRPDHMSAYGYHRPTTPNIDAFFADGIRFDHAYSTASWTRPGTASLVTGLSPTFHGANVGGVADEVTTMAEEFRRAGWSTWAFVTNGNVFAAEFAFDQGFDRFITVRGNVDGRGRGRSNNSHADSDEAHLKALDLIERLADEPAFIYIHTVDPHMPYNPPPEFRGPFTDPDYDGQIDPFWTRKKVLRKLELEEGDLEFIVGLYDEDIRFQDHTFAELMDSLDTMGLLSNTTVVVTSDHGEEFLEHEDWGHGQRLYEEVIRVPLLVRPYDPAGFSPDPVQYVQLSDVMPTLLDWHGIETGTRMHGRVIAPVADRSVGPGEPLMLYEEPRSSFSLYALRKGQDKVIFRTEGGEGNLPWASELESIELYDLSVDPLEAADRSDAEPDVAERLKADAFGVLHLFADEMEIPMTGPEPVLDEATRQHLEALGYLDGDQ